MKKSSTDDRDLVHAEVDTEVKNPGEFVVMDPEEDIWLENDIQDHDPDHQDLLDVNEASIFYSEFPSLPDFPCMSASSSSSSSSTPATVKALTCSSSSSSGSSSSTSAASWAVLKSDAEEDVERSHGRVMNGHDQGTTPAALSSTASMDFSEQEQPGGCRGGGGDENQGLDCIDMMETFGYMDLLESNDFFDPSLIFQNDGVLENGFREELLVVPRAREDEEEENNKDGKSNEEMMMMVIENDQEVEELESLENNDNNNEAPDDMAMVFLDWLRTNKETVSAEDLRSVKIKKSTIEAAAKRLGGGKEAMKQLLKLVLEWVKTNHLQKRRLKETSPFHTAVDPNPNAFATHEPNNNNNPNCFTHSPWSYDPAQTVIVPPPQAYPSPMVGFMGSDPFGNGSGHYQPAEYNTMLDSSPTWHPSQFSLASPYASFQDNNGLQTTPSQHAQAFSGYASQYPYQYYSQESDQRLVRSGSSATKEARKKRMARQRRLLSHHRHHHHNHQNHNNNNQNHQNNQNLELDHPHARLNGNTDSNCTNVAPTQPNSANWVYWPQTAAATSAAAESPPPVISGITAETPPLLTIDRNQTQGRSPTERRLGWKPEKNLRFLLQKVLKQSDVGSLGRIVLPKKEAETHLPELEARDGISIPMEDIGTSRVWNMRYRYWPNNKSRMYLLENTGDFVRANGLQEGDFIVIYSDIKCGKYMIRGVKVRQQGPNPKSENNKRPAKSQRSQHAITPAGTNNNNNTNSSITQRN